MSTWEERVSAYWGSVSREDPERAVEQMRALIAQRPEGDPAALFEWASVHDYLGREAEAIPLYQEALARGLEGERRPQALIQLASSLRHTGRPAQAAELLRQAPEDASTGSASQAFLALALHDCGRSEEALRIALVALARHLPQYGRAVEAYASRLGAGAPDIPE